MPKIIDIIHRLCPKGTSPARRPNWKKCPAWPPDLFAVTATLVNLSGCYAKPCCTSPWEEFYIFKDSYFQTVKDMSKTWQEKIGLGPPRKVQDLWDGLLQQGSCEVSPVTETRREYHRKVEPWWEKALTLMAVADEASIGIGFAYNEKNPFAYFVVVNLPDLLKKEMKKATRLPYLPQSVCVIVPPEEACIQPKTRTPQVGCTLRSLSHHLALLPSIGEVETRWQYAVSEKDLNSYIHEDYQMERPLNLLLVPFPFRVDGNCFVGEGNLPSSEEGMNKQKFFVLRQQWLQNGKVRLTAKTIGDFLLGLIERAKQEVGIVHGIVLPETSLDERQVRPLANFLAVHTDLELFITGMASPVSAQIPKNSVFTSIFLHHQMLTCWSQPKHHRWQLTGGQICHYHLGDAFSRDTFDPRGWWEKIDVGGRQCTFYVFRPGASLAALICEDLARIDPVQTVLRSIGPNLVIVLLMDGPQREGRWPGRYATVLADDPGSAVLTLTSLGMVRRSVDPGQEEPCEIALWKEASGVARELKLPKGDHALLLTLAQSTQEQFTLDGRSDHGTTTQLSLTGVRGIKHPKPPQWASLD